MLCKILMVHKEGIKEYSQKQRRWMNNNNGDVCVVVRKRRGALVKIQTIILKD